MQHRITPANSHPANSWCEFAFLCPLVFLPACFSFWSTERCMAREFSFTLWIWDASSSQKQLVSVSALAPLAVPCTNPSGVCGNLSHQSKNRGWMGLLSAQGVGGWRHSYKYAAMTPSKQSEFRHPNFGYPDKLFVPFFILKTNSVIRY